MFWLVSWIQIQAAVSFVRQVSSDEFCLVTFVQSALVVGSFVQSLTQFQLLYYDNTIYLRTKCFGWLVQQIQTAVSFVRRVLFSHVCPECWWAVLSSH